MNGVAYCLVQADSRCLLEIKSCKAAQPRFESIPLPEQKDVLSHRV
jgi:hypothetical protein